MITIPAFSPEKVAKLFDDNLPSEVVKGNRPFLFESNELRMFHQGIVVYETNLPRVEDVDVKMVVHDFAVVYIGDYVLTSVDRTKMTTHKFIISKDQI
jgi:hypothetical protein